MLTAVVLGLTTVLAIAESFSPGLLHLVQREPSAFHGQWWRLVTANFGQSAGAVQAVFNTLALLFVGPVAERVFGPVRWLGIYFGSGIAAHAVSVAGRSPTGAGNSVASCGLVAALSVHYVWRGPSGLTRVLAPLVALAGTVLSVAANNHGVGLVVGAVLGVLVTALPGSVRVAGTEPGRAVTAPR